MDLLLDVTVSVDLCIARSPHASLVQASLARCREEGGQIWLYVGSVHALESAVVAELRRSSANGESPMDPETSVVRARQILSAFAKDKQWLAALSGEGAVFDSRDPAEEQLIRAMGRFPKGEIRLLTRDNDLCGRHPDLAITPEAFLQSEPGVRPIEFIDLAAQQHRLRPQLETAIHRTLHRGQYILGPEVKELEARLADYCGAKHCITVANGTDALQIALMALGVGPGTK